MRLLICFCVIALIRAADQVPALDANTQAKAEKALAAWAADVELPAASAQAQALAQQADTELIKAEAHISLQEGAAAGVAFLAAKKAMDRINEEQRQRLGLVWKDLRKRLDAATLRLMLVMPTQSAEEVKPAPAEAAETVTSVPQAQEKAVDAVEQPTDQAALDEP